MRMKDFEWKLQLFGEDPDNPGEEDEKPDGGESKDNEGEKGEEKPEAKYTDADLDRIFNRKFAEMEKKKQKEIDEAAKLAKMTEAEKRAHEVKQLKAELAELKAANARSEMSKVARTMFSEAGVGASDSIIGKLISDDAESTKEAVESYIEIFKSEVDKAVKNKLKGETPKKGGGGSSAMTREDILKVKNRAERQKLINEHKELFGI